MCRLVLALALAAAPAGAADFATLKGHGGPIMDIAVDAEGHVATASFDNTVGLWDGGAPRWLEAHEAAATALAFVPGGLVSGGDDFAVIRWRDGAPEALGRHAGKVADVAVSPDGRTAATASWDGTVALWPLEGEAEATSIPVGTGAGAVAFAEDGTLFAGTQGGDVLRIADGTPRAIARSGFGVNTLVAGPGWLAVGTVDGATRILDPETGETLHDFTLERRPILAMDWSPDTGMLAVGDGDGWIMVVDTSTWKIVRDVRATRQGPVWALAFAPGGATLWAGGLDDVAYGWPVEALDPTPAIDGDRAFLQAASTMPNGERQFVRKCSICHALEPGPSRRAGPTLHGVFGRRAGTVPGYRYSDTLTGSPIVWSAETIDALFDQGPDHYIPGTKMPMQVIGGANDRADLIAFLETATE
ncbi:c-type cytochrome [Jannaschia sp. W003]|uniref:c-type cytochrome n=1 Tax=Jannaschia sp. W003 TaxID=2867012 RepID=UPI0021A4A445|nr:c-type cytochrome [Jannaschia sp. W003]UWQ21470.1 cytochrome C [Jannaschia sp. W003]